MGLFVRSLISFGYSKELSYLIHGFYLITPLKDILKLEEYPKENNLFRVKFIDGWNCLQIFNGDLLIEFDSIEKYIQNLEIEKFNFYGVKL